MKPLRSWPKRQRASRYDFLADAVDQGPQFLARGDDFDQEADIMNVRRRVQAWAQRRELHVKTQVEWIVPGEDAPRESAREPRQRRPAGLTVELSTKPIARPSGRAR